MRTVVMSFAALFMSISSSYADFRSNSVQSDTPSGIYKCKHIKNNSAQLGFTDQFRPSSEAIVGVSSSGLTFLLPGGGSFVASKCQKAGQHIFCSEQNYTLSMNQSEKLFYRSIKVKAGGSSLSEIKEVWSCNPLELNE